MNEPFLVVQELQKSFNGHNAVNGVSFNINKGECFGLLGPNGAGKTTTIRMLSTVLPPDAGDATIGGFSLKKQPEKVREIIAVCPQDLALYEEMSALDNLIFFGRMVGLDGKEAKRQAMENLELMELSERARAACRSIPAA
jgi:ABC-2 type transport system ATP-binding protein